MLQALATMTLRGSLLIVLACLWRLLLRRRAPGWSLVLLWGAALLRLVIPNTFSVEIAVPWLPRGSGGVWYQLQQSMPQETARGLPVVTLCWALGALALALVLGGMWLWQRRLLREALPLENDFCRLFLAERPLRRPVRLQTSDRIRTPLTLGILHPRILLPRAMDLNDKPRLACVLAHEMVHIRRFDVLLKLAALVALCLHWFNPLCWLMVYLLDRDLEHACDEKAIALLGEGQKKQYALALLALAEEKSRFSPLCSGFGRNDLRERILTIMKFQKTSRMTAALALAAVITAAGASAADISTVGPDQQGEKAEAATLTWAVASHEAGDAQLDKSKYEKFGLKFGEDNTATYEGKNVASFIDPVAGQGYFGGQDGIHLEAVYEGDTLVGVKESEGVKMLMEAVPVDGATIDMEGQQDGEGRFSISVTTKSTEALPLQ